MREILDLIILALATMRLTRLVTHDDLGLWLAREPLYRLAGYDPASGDEPANWKERAVSGLTCPFCVGFWLGSTLLTWLVLTGGPGHASPWWEAVAGAFALNYLCAHVAARLDGSADLAHEHSSRDRAGHSDQRPPSPAA